MAKDAELDCLKAAQDDAFRRKQDAYQAQQRAWEGRRTAGDASNWAFEEKQRAYAEQDRTWQAYQQVRSYNGPRIDSLNDQQEAAFQDMSRAFDNASSAHDRRDGAAASSYAAEGHCYKAESQGYVAERRRLVEEIRAARDRHEASKPAFQRAKDSFNAAKREFDAAKAEHERAQTEFKRAKVVFDAAVKAFQSRLAQVKAENQKRKDDKRSIAEKAGVPYSYCDNVWISKDTNGNTNIYFGGGGKPDGPGHGHYVLSREGKVTYKREPFDPHGAHNFQHDEQLERELGRVALSVAARNPRGSDREVQSIENGHVVKVKAGYSYDRRAVTTDVIIDESAGSDEHYHLVIDDSGSIAFSEWRKNH